MVDSAGISSQSALQSCPRTARVYAGDEDIGSTSPNGFNVKVTGISLPVESATQVDTVDQYGSFVKTYVLRVKRPSHQVAFAYRIAIGQGYLQTWVAKSE